MKHLCGLLISLAAVAALLSSAACSRNPEPSVNAAPASATPSRIVPVSSPVASPAPASETAVSAQDGDWGTVKGRVVWGGEKIPPLATITLPADNPATAQCLQANKGQNPPDEKWVVNQKNKGIKNTFVWLADFKDPKSQEPLPTHPSLKEIKMKEVEIDQPACHFIPHAIALRDGQKLLVRNNSPFPHNFKYTGNPDSEKNAGGNPLMPPGSKIALTFEADRMPILIECSIHPWMRGFIRVYSHPYFAVTDDNGAFEFKNAPAGKYRLMVWHGSAGWRNGAKGNKGEPITIKGGEVNDTGDLNFPPPVD